MTTSRTGTAAYKRWRKRVLTEGQAAGITHCQCGCGTELDYQVGKKPNSAEPDHILAHYYGGRNDVDNGRVLARKCNQSRGKGDRKARETAKPVQASAIW